MNFDWLTTRPIAHRGLHDGATRIENSISAAHAAAQSGFAIECDVQLTRDGEVVVFHDFELDRLTNGSGPLITYDLKQLSQFLLKSSEAIPSLEEFLSDLNGRTPLFIEIKSRFDGDLRLAKRVAEYAAAYAGALALESFDPQVMAYLRREQKALGLSHVALGMVAQANYDRPDDEWAHLPQVQREALARFDHQAQTRPDFLSWSLRDLPHDTPHDWHERLGRPLTIWTVRNRQDAERARQSGGQIVFEGFNPSL